MKRRGEDARAHGPLCASAGRERGRRPWLSAARRTDPRQRGCETEARRHGRRPRSRPSPVDSHAARCPHGRPDPRPTAPLPMARPNPRRACACVACAYGPAADKFCDVTVTASVSSLGKYLPHPRVISVRIYTKLGKCCQVLSGPRFDVTATIGERAVPRHGIYLLTADIADSSHGTNDRISKIKQLPDERKNMIGTV